MVNKKAVSKQTQISKQKSSNNQTKSGDKILENQIQNMQYVFVFEIVKLPSFSHFRAFFLKHFFFWKKLSGATLSCRFSVAKFSPYYF